MPRFDGADISHHQDDAGPIDWPTLRAASLGAWVATKATQSTGYVDPTCDTHRAQMGAQGFKHRGLYHWLSSTTAPAAQAAHYLDCVGTLHVGEFVMLDAEEGGITVAKVLAWLRAVEGVTHRPAAVYTGAYVAGGTIWQNTEVRHSLYGPRPMHLAAYTTEAKAKALPGVKAYPWDAWQWSSNGPVPGVTGRCDMNRIDNPLVFDIAAGLNFPPPQPQPEDDDMKLATNEETRTMPYGEAPPLTAIFVVGTRKRNISGEEYADLYGAQGAVPLRNATLDLIPDEEGEGGGVVDQVARDEALHANEAITRITATISDIRMGGQRIADAGGR